MGLLLKLDMARRVSLLRVLPLAMVAMVAIPASAQDAPNSQWGTGENLYEKVCALCHAPAVGVGPAIAGRALPEAYIKLFVRNGFNAMPAFPASFIDDRAIAEVTKYLASLPAAPADQSSGGQP